MYLNLTPKFEAKSILRQKLLIVCKKLEKNFFVKHPLPKRFSNFTKEIFWKNFTTKQNLFEQKKKKQTF